MTDSLWSDGWPDWADAGKRVTLLDADGSQLTGELEVGDFVPLDDGDEVPIFSVRTSDGVEHSFAGAEKWRFA
jgi:hypothetical protein